MGSQALQPAPKLSCPLGPQAPGYTLICAGLSGGIDLTITTSDIAVIPRIVVLVFVLVPTVVFAIGTVLFSPF